MVVGAEVPSDVDGVRLDRFVARVCELSRRQARILIRTGRVKLRGKVVRVMTKPLKAGWTVEIVREQDQCASKTPTVRTNESSVKTLEVVHLDERLIAINKPAGLLSEAERPSSGSVSAVVSAWLAESGEQPKVELVHRLDAGTSGIMVLARTRVAASALGRLFAARAVKKVYLALVAGNFASAREHSGAIGRGRGSQRIVRSDGKPAFTAFEPVSAADGASLVRATPKTGRTHQIRVHLADLGYPIIGDGLYGGLKYIGSAQDVVVTRPLLHAESLWLPGFDGGGDLMLEASVPVDFVSAAKTLGHVWP